MNLGIRIVMCLILCGAPLAAAKYFIFDPANQRIAEIREDERAKREKLADIKARALSSQDSAQQIEQLRKAIEVLESKLPEEKEMDKVLRDISQLAADNGMITKSWRPDRPEDQADYSQLSIKIQMTGTWGGYYKFLKAMEENLSRIIRISEMALVKQDGKEGQVTASMTLTIFFDHGHKQLAEAR